MRRKKKTGIVLAQMVHREHKESILYAFGPNPDYKLGHQLLRCIDTVIHRLLLGTAYTKHFSFKTQLASSSTCSCGHDDDDIYHLLIDCPKYTTQRQRHEQELRLLDPARTFSLAKILGPWPPEVHHKTSKAFRRFSEETEMNDSCRLDCLYSVGVCETRANYFKAARTSLWLCSLFFIYI